MREVYDLEDALLMWEAVVIPRYNEYLSRKRAANKRGR